MAKKRGKTFLAVGILVIVAALLHSAGLFVITGSETMIRTATTQVEVGSSFDVTYTAQNTEGSWGLSLIDTISGGCTFVGGVTEYKTVMLSTDGQSKTVTVQAPNTETTCTMAGDFQYGTSSIKNLGSLTVEVKSCNTDADTNCDGTVSRDELGLVITQWINGQVTRNQLGESIVAWIS